MRWHMPVKKRKYLRRYYAILYSISFFVVLCRNTKRKKVKNVKKNGSRGTAKSADKRFCSGVG